MMYGMMYVIQYVCNVQLYDRAVPGTQVLT